MSIFLPAASIALTALLACAVARAQPVPELSPGPTAPSSEPTAPSSEPTPPVVQSSTDVPYPEGGAGDAAVVLDLVIETDGSVSRALVVDGAAPFAEHARTAALNWRFTPAQLDGKPAAVRIRARVEFNDASVAPSPAVPSLAPRVAESGAPSVEVSREPTPSTESVVEVTVVGARREVGQTSLSKSDVREMPGAFGDAFRAIEALPGVTPLASGIPYFYVRGAPPAWWSTSTSSRVPRRRVTAGLPER